MSKQWPKCLRVYPYWEQSGNGFDQENCHIAEPWDLASRDDLSPKEAKYTRTDIAEARIAELEGALRKIAGVAHYGGLMGYDSTGDAIAEVRRLSQQWVDSDECTRLQIKRDPVLCASLGFYKGAKK